MNSVGDINKTFRYIIFRVIPFKCIHAFCESKGKLFVRETKLTCVHSILYTSWPVAGGVNLINCGGTWITKHIKISILAHSDIYQKLVHVWRYHNHFSAGSSINPSTFFVKYYSHLSSYCTVKLPGSLVHLIFVYFKKGRSLFRRKRDVHFIFNDVCPITFNKRRSHAACSAQRSIKDLCGIYRK